MLWRNMINVNHLEKNCCVAHCKPDKYKCQGNNKDFCTQKRKKKRAINRDICKL